MIKLVTLLSFFAVVLTLVFLQENRKSVPSTLGGGPPPISIPIALAPETLGMATGSGEVGGWKTYTSEDFGIRLRLPNDIKISNSSDGSLDLTKDSLNISIFKFPLAAKDTVNTVAEKDINSKIENLGDKFKLKENISPIALGSQTGITYGTEEQGKETTYYYLPLGFHYLLITNKTVNSSDTNQISLSDDIIFSLEFIDK